MMSCCKKYLSNKTVRYETRHKMETRAEYIERMANIAVKMNWTEDDYRWLNNHLGKNDLVAEIKRLVKQSV